jgi:hypothetical protein
MCVDLVTTLADPHEKVVGLDIPMNKVESGCTRFARPEEVIFMSELVLK